MTQQNPGERQSGEIRRERDRKIETSRNDRDQHRQCQKAELRQLKSHRSEVFGGQEARGREAEHRYDDDQEQEEADDLGSDRLA